MLIWLRTIYFVVIEFLLVLLFIGGVLLMFFILFEADSELIDKTKHFVLLVFAQVVVLGASFVLIQWLLKKMATK